MCGSAITPTPEQLAHPPLDQMSQYIADSIAWWSKQMYLQEIEYIRSAGKQFEELNRAPMIRDGRYVVFPLRTIKTSFTIEQPPERPEPSMKSFGRGSGWVGL